MRSEICISILILGLSNILSWFVNYLDNTVCQNVQENIINLQETQIKTDKKINIMNNAIKDVNTTVNLMDKTIKLIGKNIENIEESEINTKKMVKILEKQVTNLQNSCNIFSGNFESNMKTKSNNIIKKWF